MDNTLPILRDMEKDGRVTYHSDPAYNIGNQMQCYNLCLKDHGMECEWLAFIDIDEFLFSPGGAPIFDILDFIGGSDSVAAVAVHWLMFGSGGEGKYEKGLVLERFTHSANEINQHVKSIVKPNKVLSAGKNPHTFRVCGKVVDENNRVLETEYACSPYGTANHLRINHYHLKSKEEYFARKSDRGETQERLTHCFEVHDKNEVMDICIKQFIPTLKSLMEQKKYG